MKSHQLIAGMTLCLIAAAAQEAPADGPSVWATTTAYRRSADGRTTARLVDHWGYRTHDRPWYYRPYTYYGYPGQPWYTYGYAHSWPRYYTYAYPHAWDYYSPPHGYSGYLGVGYYGEAAATSAAR